MQPFVSIIIPVFNDQVGIETCLRFVESTTYSSERYEVIVVDNGSTPALILPVFTGGSVKLVRCGERGSYAARNAGVKVASGDVLAFIDADCWPAMSWLERGVVALAEASTPVVIGGDVLFDMPSNPSSVALYQGVVGFGQKDNIENRRFSATANLFCTRSIFEQIGSFDERLLSGGDREWCWRATRSGVSVRFAPDAIVYTKPRETLGDAVRQARRVAAGRKYLREKAHPYIQSDAIKKQRSPMIAFVWIWQQAGLNAWEKARVTIVASIIFVATGLERLRLLLGAQAERR